MKLTGLTLPKLIAAITFLAVFAMAARVSVDSDTWWHLRTGEWILEHRSIPQADPFSHTRLGADWHYPGWLVQTPMALLFRLGGAGALNLWTAAMVTLAFALLWPTLSGGPFLRAFVTILAATVSGVYWAARPYLVTFVLAAAFLAILECYRWQPGPAAQRRLVWLPVLMMVWVNSHGGFAVGFILWGVYLAGALWALLLRRGNLEARQQATTLAWVGGGLLLAACLSPAGPAILAYPFQTVGISALQDYIQEWQSPNFHLLHVQPFAWLLLLTLGAVGVSRRRLVLTDFLLVAGFAYLGLMAGRNVALFALAAPPALTRHLAPVMAALGRRLGWRGVSVRPPGRFAARLNLVLLALIALAVAVKAALVLPAEVNARHFRATLPVAAADFIRAETAPGRLFNSYNWGGYLLWALPDHPVFIDGRTDLYNDEVISTWLQAMRAEAGWESILAEHGIDLIVVEKASPLDRALVDNPAWRLIYNDDLAVVYQPAVP